MEEVVNLPPMEFFNDDYQMVLDFIESLGNPKFKIAGNIDFNGKRNIITLGNLVEVDGDLDLGHTPIEELPNLEKVGGYIDLMRSSIKKLPDNLIIVGDLFLSNTDIEYLPDNLTVNNLYLTFSNIKELPKNLKVNGLLKVVKSSLSKYTEDEIREIVVDKGGFIKGEIVI